MVEVVKDSAHKASKPKKEYIWGTGRRKTSVARVRIAPGEGKILVNDRPLEKFFTIERRSKDVARPLDLAGVRAKFDVFMKVNGGGETGQAGACLLGIARALIKADPALQPLMKSHGLLTRDDRKVERKKYGLHKARRASQFSKR